MRTRVTRMLVSEPSSLSNAVFPWLSLIYLGVREVESKGPDPGGGGLSLGRFLDELQNGVEGTDPPKMGLTEIARPHCSGPGGRGAGAGMGCGAWGARGTHCITLPSASKTLLIDPDPVPAAPLPGEALLLFWAAQPVSGQFRTTPGWGSLILIRLLKIGSSCSRGNLELKPLGAPVGPGQQVRSRWHEGEEAVWCRFEYMGKRRKMLREKAGSCRGCTEA